MKKYLIIPVGVLALFAGTTMAATNDFVADGDFTIESVSGTGVTANLTILNDSTANSVTSNSGVLTVTNPGSAFKVTGSNANIVSLQADNGSETSCANNINPGTTYLQVPESAGTYTITPSKNGCSASSGGSSSSSGGGGGTPPPPATPVVPATPAVPTISPAVPASPALIRASSRASFNRQLVIGSVGDDVKSLQQFLNSRGFMVSPAGPGAPGNETKFFGPATRAAVIKFQLANGIIQSATGAGAGHVGPKTRARINELNGAASIVPAVGRPAPVGSLRQNQLNQLVQLLQLLRQLQAPR